MTRPEYRLLSEAERRAIAKAEPYRIACHYCLEMRTAKEWKARARAEWRQAKRKAGG